LKKINNLGRKRDSKKKGEKDQLSKKKNNLKNKERRKPPKCQELNLILIKELRKSLCYAYHCEA
jgi:hypothetical protein